MRQGAWYAAYKNLPRPPQGLRFFAYRFPAVKNMREEWVQRLKSGYDAGYYRTETDEGSQSSFPWQDKTCGDCPFWLNGVCRVQAVVRPAEADTCQYFDPHNHRAGQGIINNRMRDAWKRWLERQDRGSH